MPYLFLIYVTTFFLYTSQSLCVPLCSHGLMEAHNFSINCAYYSLSKLSLGSGTPFKMTPLLFTMLAF